MSSKLKKSILDIFLLFLKGLFMGSADIIPGVSGGTVAFITGIYERLVNALKSINFKFIIYFFRGFFDKRYFKKSKDNFFEIEFYFLIPLAVGVAVAFLSLAHIIGFLLDYYPTYTYAFFFGLILSSSVFVYKSNNKKINIFDIIFIIFGLIVGFLLVGLEQIGANHSLILIFFSGMITFCAMILPGISGAFILIFLGQYHFLLSVLREIASLDFSRISYALTYIIGGLAGLLVFSRILSYLLSKYRSVTLSFIVGLMIGALRNPIEFIIADQNNMFITILSSIMGIILVVIIGYYGRNIEGFSSN